MHKWLVSNICEHRNAMQNWQPPSLLQPLPTILMKYWDARKTLPLELPKVLRKPQQNQTIIAQHTAANVRKMQPKVFGQPKTQILIQTFTPRIAKHNGDWFCELESPKTTSWKNGHAFFTGDTKPKVEAQCTTIEHVFALQRLPEMLASDTSLRPPPPGCSSSCPWSRPRSAKATSIEGQGESKARATILDWGKEVSGQKGWKKETNRTNKYQHHTKGNMWRSPNQNLWMSHKFQHAFVHVWDTFKTQRRMRLIILHEKRSQIWRLWISHTNMKSSTASLVTWCWPCVLTI